MGFIRRCPLSDERPQGIHGACSLASLLSSLPSLEDRNTELHFNLTVLDRKISVSLGYVNLHWDYWLRVDENDLQRRKHDIKNLSEVAEKQLMCLHMKHASGMTGVWMFCEYYFLTPHLGKTFIFRYRAYRLFESPLRVNTELVLYLMWH